MWVNLLSYALSGVILYVNFWIKGLENVLVMLKKERKNYMGGSHLIKLSQMETLNALIFTRTKFSATFLCFLTELRIRIVINRILIRRQDFANSDQDRTIRYLHKLAQNVFFLLNFKTLK